MTVFCSAWETPRERLNRVLEEIASEYAGQAVVVKSDVAGAPQAQAQHEVDSLPQFLFFRQGKVVGA